MKVEDAATGNTGVWISFCAVVVLYLAVGITTILVLRGMSRRFRRAGGFIDHDAPYGPSAPPEEPVADARGGGRGEHRGRRGAAASAVLAYAVFGGADFGAGFWDLTPGGPERGARPRAVIEHSIGPVWEANHVWLIFIFVILWTAFPEAYASITLTLFVPLMIAALGIVLRGASFAFRKAVVTHPEPSPLRSRVRRSPRCWFRTAWERSSAGSPRAECRPAARRGIRWTAGSTRPPIVGGVLAVVAAAYLSAVYLVWDARRLGQTDMAEYFRRRAVASAVVVAVIAAAGALRAARRCRLPVRRAHLARPAGA